MTIQDKIKHLQEMKAGKEPAQVEIIESIIESLRILRNTFSNPDSESVIISMSNHDYVLFEEFKTFKKFAAEIEKEKNPVPDPVIVGPSPETEIAVATLPSETPETTTA